MQDTTNGTQDSDEGTSELFYQLIKKGITEDVATHLDTLITQGTLALTDLTDRVEQEIKDVTPEVMELIAEELNSSELSHLKNKAAYLIGLIKTHKKKAAVATPTPVAAAAPATTESAKTENNTETPAAEESASETNQTEDTAAAADDSVDSSKLNITFGKHYRGTKLGPDFINEDKIKALVARTGYRLDISPGQRQYGPPPNWEGPPPGKGCELFIGGLLRETFEDTLVPLIEKSGEVYEVRIMTNPTDFTNKGFCFCIMTTSQAAQKCVSQMNGMTMGRNRKLKVNIHSPNLRLFCGGVDRKKDADQIKMAIGALSEGLTDVILKEDTEHPNNKHRGFVFLDYDNHKNASNAIKRLQAPGTLVFGKQLFADWAEPLEEVSDEVMAKVKVLYVKGLKSTITEELIKDRFVPYGPIDSVKRLKDYAFVHYKNREHALQAMNDLHNTKIEDCTIDVTLAKPSGQNKKKENRPGAGGFGDSVRGRGGGGPPSRGGGFGMRGGGMNRGPPMRGGGAPMRGGGASMRGGGAPMRAGGASMRGGGAPMRGGGAAMRGGGAPMRSSAPLLRRPAPAYGGADDRYGGYDDYPAPAQSRYAADPYAREEPSSYPGLAGYRMRSTAEPARGRVAPRGSPRGAPVGRGGPVRSALMRAPSPRGGMVGGVAPKRPAPSGYGGYEAPVKRDRPDWSIPQQPLSQQGYGAAPTRAESSWYQDSSW